MDSGAGALTDADSKIIVLLLSDATWIEEYHKKVNDRLAYLMDLERLYPGGEWEQLPTMSETLAHRRGQITSMLANAQFEGLEKAIRAAESRARDLAEQRETKRQTFEQQRKQQLHELALKFIDAEYDVRDAAIQAKIEERQIQRRVIQQQVREKVAVAKDDKLRKYLKSERVKNLLAPFINPGRSYPNGSPSSRTGLDRGLLQPGPMPLSGLKDQTKWGQGAYRVRHLVHIAADPANDRGASWGIQPDSWSTQPNDFQDMDGNLVNRYAEAFRIIEEHGAVLVELKMLRP